MGAYDSTSDNYTRSHLLGETSCIMARLSGSKIDEVVNKGVNALCPGCRYNLDREIPDNLYEIGEE